MKIAIPLLGMELHPSELLLGNKDSRWRKTGVFILRGGTLSSPSQGGMKSL
jgi:hypothetical protein